MTAIALTSNRSSTQAIAQAHALRVLLVESDATEACAIAHDFARDAIELTITSSLADARFYISEHTSSLDVIILELALCDGRGESLLPLIEGCVRQPVVIIASATLTELQPEALEYRPVVVAKPLPPAKLRRIVKAVAGGYTWPLIRRFVQRFRLSSRETEAMTFVAQGMKPKQAAERMGCSEKNVYAHLARVCRKVGCSDYHEVVGEFVAFACQALGHTPPEHRAFRDGEGPGEALPLDAVDPRSQKRSPNINRKADQRARRQAETCPARTPRAVT